MLLDCRLTYRAMSRLGNLSLKSVAACLFHEAGALVLRAANTELVRDTNAKHVDDNNDRIAAVRMPDGRQVRTSP
jgi:hypothetical protein